MRFTTLAAAGILALIPLWNQTALNAAQESSRAVDATDLWGLWREGFEKYEAAEETAKKGGRQDEAIKLYQQAKNLFERIRRQNPNWNKEVIAYRISLCDRRVKEIDQPRKDALARAQKQKEDAARSAAQETERLRKDLRQARLEIIELKNRADKNARSADQVKSLLAEKETLESKLSAASVQLEATKRKLVESEKASKLKRQILAEKARVEEYQRQLKMLNSKIEKMQIDKANEAAKNAEIAIRLKNAEAKVRDLTAALDILKTVKAENDQIRKDKAALELQIKNLRTELDRSAQTADNLRNKLALIRSGKEVLPSVKKLEDELALAKKESEYRLSQINSLNVSLKELQEKEKAQTEKSNKIAIELARAVADQTALRNENANLKKQLAEAKTKSGTDQKAIAALTAERDTVRRELKALAAKYEETRKSAEENESRKLEVIKLREQYTQLQKANTSLRAELDAYKKDLAALQASKKQLESNVLKNVKQELQSVKAENEKLQKDATALKLQVAQIEKMKKENAQLKENLEAFRAQSTDTDKLQSSNKKLAEQIKTLTAQTVALQQTIEKRQQEITKQKESVKNLQKELADAKATAENAEKHIQQLKSSSSKNIQELEADLKKTRLALQKTTQQKEQVETDLQKARSGQKTTDVQPQTAVSKGKETVTKTVTVVKEVKVTDPKTQEMLKNNTVEISYLRQQLSNAQTKRSELEAKLAEAEKKLVTSAAANKIEIENLERVNKQLQGKINEFRNNTDKSTREEIRKLEATVTELIEGKTQYENAVKSLTQLRDALKKQNTALEHELKIANEEIALLKANIAKAKSKVNEDRKKNELLNKLGQFEKNNAELTAEQKKLKARIAELDKNLSSVRKELQTANAAALRYQNELKNWSDGPSKAKDSLMKRKDEAISDLVKEGVELRKELSTLKAELSMSRDEIRRVRAQAIAIAKKYQKARQQLQKISKEGKSAEANVVVGKPVAAKSGTDKKEEETLITEKKSEQTPVDQKKYAEAMKAAKEAEKASDASGALMNYWRAADANPNSAEAYAGLARIYLLRKEKVSAAKSYSKAIELGYPKDAKIEKELKK